MLSQSILAFATDSVEFEFSSCVCFLMNSNFSSAQPSPKYSLCNGNALWNMCTFFTLIETQKKKLHVNVEKRFFP